MADTSNLSKFLTDVAQAIRDKKGSDAMIPAKNFDTEIADITTGIDTSDATATSMDLPSGVTAYARGEKITGALNKYENVELMQVYGGYANQGSIVEIKSTPHVGNPDLYGEGTVVSIMVPKEENGLVAENIVEGANIFGIEGTGGGGGIDTSDATATESDIVVGKTAYANGEKLEGSVTELVRGGARTYDIDTGTLTNRSNDLLYNMNAPYTAVLRWDAPMSSVIPHSDIATAISLTADQIVSGNTVLGVEGTAVFNGVKLFTSINEMNASEGNNLGDLALIQEERADTTPITLSDVSGGFVEPYCPKVVKLQTPVTENIEIIFNPSDENVTVTITPTIFGYNYTDESGQTYRIQYSSEDGITYTRQYPIDNAYVSLGIYVSGVSGWNDVLSNFMYKTLYTTVFNGLYRYSFNTEGSTVWTQIAITPSVNEYDMALDTATDILGEPESEEIWDISVDGTLGPVSKLLMNSNSGVSSVEFSQPSSNLSSSWFYITLLDGTVLELSISTGFPISSTSTMFGTTAKGFTVYVGDPSTFFWMFNSDLRVQLKFEGRFKSFEEIESIADNMDLEYSI